MISYAYETKCYLVYKARNSPGSFFRSDSRRLQDAQAVATVSQYVVHSRLCDENRVTSMENEFTSISLNDGNLSGIYWKQRYFTNTVAKWTKIVCVASRLKENTFPVGPEPAQHCEKCSEL